MNQNNPIALKNVCYYIYDLLCQQIYVIAYSSGIILLLN